MSRAERAFLLLLAVVGGRVRSGGAHHLLLSRLYPRLQYNYVGSTAIIQELMSEVFTGIVF